MKTLEEYLQRNAELYPDDIAIVNDEDRLTYSQLWHRVEARAAQLQAEADSAISQGSIKGTLVPFRAVCEIDTLVLYFAIHLVGGIAIPLDKDLPEEQFRAFCQLANVNVPEGTADVLFTTGTTGKQKGVIISHAAILADAENLVAAQGYHHDLTFIICGPLNHIGSLSKVYPMMLVGGTIQLLDGIKDMEAWFRVMEQPKEPTFDETPDFSKAPKHTFASFLVPASIRMLMAFSADRLAHNADRIEFIETGAAPMAQADMERFCQLLPHSRLYNTYASTETGIIATYDYNHGECLAGCLGKPMKHSEVMIVSDGRVACKGKTLMSGYLGDEELTASVLRDNTVYTADLGRIDDQGRLRLEGRTGDVINVGGYKVIPTEVEDAAMSLPMVKDCICIPAQHRVLGMVLKLLVVLEDGYALDKKTIAKGLQQHLANYKVPTLYEQVDTIRRTFNGKIDRKSYVV